MAMAITAMAVDGSPFVLLASLSRYSLIPRIVRYDTLLVYSPYCGVRLLLAYSSYCEVRHFTCPLVPL